MKDNEFRKRVYQLLLNIPKGKVVSYGRLAELAGNPRAARVVGNFMKENKKPEKIPCYKVVKSDGKVGEYSAKGGVKRKIYLLKKDGIEVRNGRIDKKFYF